MDLDLLLKNFNLCCYLVIIAIQRGSSADVVVKLLACRARGPVFDSRSRHYDFRDWLFRFQVAIWLKYHRSDVNPQNNQPTKPSYERRCFLTTLITDFLINPTTQIKLKGLQTPLLITYPFFAKLFKVAMRLFRNVHLLFSSQDYFTGSCPLNWYIAYNYSQSQSACFLAFGWLVGCFLINVDLAIFQPYLDLEAGDNQSLKIQVARRGIEPRSSCSASQELNHSATAAPPCFFSND